MNLRIRFRNAISRVRALIALVLACFIRPPGFRSRTCAGGDPFGEAQQLGWRNLEFFVACLPLEKVARKRAGLRGKA